MANEPEADALQGSWRAGQPNHHPDPVAMCASAMARVERKTPQTIKDRLAAIHLDRQHVVRAVPDDDIGTGIDRRMANLAHIREHILVKSPVTGRDDDIHP